MDIKKFKEWRESDDFKYLSKDSNVILYKNSFTGRDDSNWEWGIWGARDVYDDLLKQSQKDFKHLCIKRMKVSDILKQDAPEYNYVKKWVSEEFLKNISKLFPNPKAFKDSLDYSYLRGTNIVKMRFQEACEEAGIKMPEKIEGYRYI